jgi:hypothetical protein
VHRSAAGVYAFGRSEYEIKDRVTMQVFIQDPFTVIAAPSKVTLMEYRRGRITRS